MKEILSISLFSHPQLEGGIEAFNRNLKELFFPNMKIITKQIKRKKIYKVSDIIEIKENKIFKILNKIFKDNLRKLIIRNIVKKINPEIIITSNFYELDCLKRINCKKILVQHFNYEVIKKSIPNNNLNEYLDYYIVLSPKDKKKFIEGFDLLEKKVKIIRHTCSIDIFKGKKEKNKKLVMISRVDNRFKRFDLVIKAMKKLSDYTLNIYGDYNTEDDKIFLDGIIEQNKVTNVFFKGTTNKVQEKLDKSGIFIMTSDSEGYPISTIEAMRRGLPIVIRNTFESASDIVVDNKNGILLEKEWDEDKFVEAVKEVYNNYDYYSENAIKLGARYNPEIIKKEWYKLLNEIKEN